MTRLATLTSIIAFAVLLAASPGVITAHQASTPPAGIELAPGVYAEVFAGAPSDRAPGQTVYLARFTFHPDSEIFPHGHPGTTVLAIESGTLGWTLMEGTAWIIRGAAAGATGPIETIATPGTEVMLNPGDEIFYEEDVIHTARGASDESAIVLATLVLDADAPLLMPADMDMDMDMGTPAS